MKTPDCRQIEDLKTYLLYHLQHDTDLLTQLDPDDDGPGICRAARGFKGLEQRDEGLDVYATEFPCLCVWPKTWSQQMVGGILGWSVDLGVQYIFKAPIGEPLHPMVERANYWLNAIAWKLFHYSLHAGLLTASGTAPVVSGSIYRVHFDTFSVIPMAGEITGLEGSGVLETKYPPWAPAATQPLYDVLGTIQPDDVATPDPFLSSQTTVGTRPTP